MKATITSSLGTTAWHHVAVAWHAGEVTTFVDGATTVTTSDPEPPQHDDQVQVGRGVEDTLAVRFRGDIDELRVYGRALLPTEVKDVFDGNL